MFTVNDIWKFIGNDLVYSLRHLNESAVRSSKLSSNIRVTQKRLELQECPYNRVLSKRKCLPNVSTKYISKKPFGGSSGRRFLYTEDAKISWLPHSLSEYGPGGFSFSFDAFAPLNATRDLLDSIRSDSFIDSQTSLLMVEFVLSNNQLRLLQVVRFLISMPNYGGIETSSYFGMLTVEISTVMMAFDVLLLLTWLVAFTFDLLSIFRNGFRQHFKQSLWNFLHSINLVAVLFLIILRSLILFSIVKLNSLAHADGEYVDWASVSYSTEQARGVAAVCLFLFWMETLRFVVSGGPRFLLLERVLENAAKDIFSFLAMFLVVFCGFVTAFHMCYGVLVRDYRTWALSFVTLFRALPGDFDFETIQQQGTLQAAALYISFAVLIFFTLLNMFAAFVQDAYAMTKYEIEELKRKASKPKNPRLKIRRAISKMRPFLKTASMRRLK